MNSRLVTGGWPSAGGKSVLVQVGQPQAAAEDFPGAVRPEVVECVEFVRGGASFENVRDRGRAAGRDRCLRRRQVRAPQPGRVGLDLVVGATAEHRSRVVSRLPAADRVLVVLVQQEPLLLAGPVGVPSHQDQPAAEFVTVHVGVQLARRDGGGGVIGGVRFPGSAVPDDDVTAAVLAGRDHPFEVQVLDRVVFDVHGRALHGRVQRRSPGDGPAHEHAADFEPEVVVQPAGSVQLHHEPGSALAGARGGDPDGSGVWAKSRLRW